KPLLSDFVLRLMRPRVDGFAASSLFEARLARAVLGDSGDLHMTTPGFRPHEISELDRLCTSIAFNSLSQFERLAGELGEPGKAGLRVNPRFSLVADDRYDPCRRSSKLGVPIGRLCKALRRDPGLVERLGGLHFHTNCDSRSYVPLLR